jgi:hypothetical protein
MQLLKWSCSSIGFAYPLFLSGSQHKNPQEEVWTRHDWLYFGTRSIYRKYKMAYGNPQP